MSINAWATNPPFRVLTSKHVYQIDLVVTNYRTPHDLAAFLHSLDRSPPRTPYTLTVVSVTDDPGSEKILDLWAEEHDFDRYLFTDNVGYATASNRGAQLGKGDVVAIFNADIILNGDALDDCYEALQANPEWGIIGPRQVDTGGRMTHAGIFGTQFHPEHRGWLHMDNGTFSDVRPAVTVAGSAFFVRRECWDQLTSCATFERSCESLGYAAPEGAFLPTRFYFEETYVCYHAFAHGWAVMYYGPACLIHKWHGAVRHNDVESWAMQQMKVSKEAFVQACRDHQMNHD